MNEIEQLQRDSGALLRIARCILRDAHGAEDAVQDAWLAQAQQSTQVGPGWLRTVVRRGALRRRRAERSRPAETSLEAISTGNQGLAAEPAGALIGRAEAALRVATAIQALPADYREVIERRFWDEQPPRTIAKELRIEPKAVRNRLHRALAQLREELGDHPSGWRLWIALAEPKGARLAAARPRGARVQKAVSRSGGASLGVHSGAWWIGIGALAAVAVLAVHPDFVHDSSSELVLPASSADPIDATAVHGDDHNGWAHLMAPDQSERLDRAPAPQSVNSSGSESKDQQRSVVEDHLEGTAFGHIDVTVVVPGSSVDEPLGPFTVTLIGEDTLQRVPSGALNSTPVSVGTYEGFLLLKQWEVAELGIVVIEQGKVTDLGTVRMSPGTSVLRGRVSLSPKLTGRPLTLSLPGSRRSVGACCESTAAGQAGARCSVCGLGPGGSKLDLAPPYEFSLDRLTSGPQRLVVSAQGEGVLATREFALERSEQGFVDIDVSHRDIEVLLVDETDRPFEGVWVEDNALYSAPIILQAWASDLIVAVARVEAPPLGAGVSLGGTLTQVVSGDLPASTAANAMGERGAALWPDALPRPEDLQLPPRRVEARGQGHFRILDVPGEVTGVQVACGPFVTQLLALPDLADDTGPLRVLIDHRCGMRSAELTGAANLTCVSCHVQAY